jgi:protein phosphatase
MSTTAAYHGFFTSNHYTAIVLLTIPERSLVLLIGAAGSGKSTLARKHFKSTEIVSSDALRAMVSDDEADQSASGDAFHLLRPIAMKRLRRGRLTVIDATNVQRPARKSLLAIAAQTSAPTTAIVLNLPLDTCLARNRTRLNRLVDPDVVEKQVADLTESMHGLAQEGFQRCYLLENTEDIDSICILRV